MDVIDIQTCPDGEYKFIFNHQDHLDKYVELRPLKSKTANEVARNVISIFCRAGAPSAI